MSPTVTVIVPTYNRLSTLPRAIHSIANQTFTDWEIILVDDHSSDGTKDWIFQQDWHKKQQPFHYLQMDQQNGVSRARNEGIKLTTGKWVAFLDSDDEWLPHKLSAQLNCAKINPHLSIIHGEEIWIRNAKRVNPCKHHKKSGGWIFQKCLPLCVISPSTVIVKREVFQQVGLFREEFPVCEDYDLWLRIASSFEVGFVDQPLTIKYGGHPDQLSKRFSCMDYWRVKALFPFLSLDLKIEDKRAVIHTLLKKTDILLKGYRKHNNWQNFSEIESIRAQTLQLLS